MAEIEEKMKEPILGADACIKDSTNMEYENKLLVIKPSNLSEEYRFGEFQYFYAKCGFGCYPDKLGTKVFGEFLIDGEECQFHRYEFFGVADEEKLPDWAKQKLDDLRNKEKEEINLAKEMIGQQLG